MQVSTAEFRKGLRIVFDGNPYTIVDFQHVKPGKGGAFVRTKLKHMTLGKAIAKTDPGVRGDTAQGGTKPATLETGAVILVPLFLNEGDIVKVDTRTGEYLGRVATAATRWPAVVRVPTRASRPWSRWSASWARRSGISASPRSRWRGATW